MKRQRRRTRTNPSPPWRRGADGWTASAVARRSIGNWSGSRAEP